MFLPVGFGSFMFLHDLVMFNCCLVAPACVVEAELTSIANTFIAR